MSRRPVILYIEDDDDNRKLVGRVLTVAGFDVRGVVDGRRGLEFVKTQTPDLILMDINLPDEDGYSVTRRLRDIDRLAGVPIVAVTANVMKGDREATLQAGCDGYIQKPIDVDRLPGQIRQYLTNKPTHQ